MNNALIRLSARFDSLQKRERLLVAFSGLVALVLVFFILAIEPLYLKTAQLEQQIDQKIGVIDRQSRQITILEEGLVKDPSQRLKDEIARLTARDDTLTTLLRERSLNLMNPSMISGILESVLKETEGLVLKQLTTVPVEPITLGVAAQSDDADSTATNESIPTEAPSVYKHAFKMELKGSYRALYDYLSRLESLTQAFFWESLALSIDEYPNGNIELQVYTLSAEQGWLGG